MKNRGQLASVTDERIFDEETYGTVRRGIQRLSEGSLGRLSDTAP
jgi:hypothetical protein